MEYIKEYILSVCAAAVLCSLVKGFVDKKGPAGELVHMMCGVFLTVTAVSPLLQFRVRDISSYVQSFSFEASEITSAAEQEAEAAMNEIIIAKAREYIMDKATSMNTDIEVDILLTDDTPGIPCGAVIVGNVSPYAKTRLTQIMESDLGIPREAQQWKNRA